MTGLTIATLFPLDTVAAGDDANATALVRRAGQRGLEATRVNVNRPEAMADAQIFLLGGAGTVGVADLVAHLRATDLAERVRAGRSIVFAVDAGLVAVGRDWTDAKGQVHQGLGLVGTRAQHANAAARSVATQPANDLGLPAMVGWTSGGASISHDPGVTPLVEVLGSPEEPTSMRDGVLADGVIGTSLHGPVLALNPELADLVLARALGVTGWDPLPMPGAELARSRRITELAEPVTPKRRLSRRRR